MKVIDILKKKEESKSTNPLFSFEIIPPERGGHIEDVFNIVDKLKKFNPSFLGITSHASKAIYEDQPDGSVKRKVVKERPGTLGICGAIKWKYGIETVAHLCCRGFTKKETEFALIDLDYLHINNLFLVRGDEPGYKKLKNEYINDYAIDLVKQVVDINNGKYLEKIVNAFPKDFCVGVAGYPEKHIEAPNSQSDIKRLKEKVDAGAQYIITQMFFDNHKYFNFVDKCRKQGINIPIIPGLKVLTKQSHIKNIPKKFYIDISEELEQNVMESKDKKICLERGVNWAISQCSELIGEGVPYIHFFVMNDVEPTLKVIRRFK
jgi:methylenetetrahydrofolate reductase (NADPH)